MAGIYIHYGSNPREMTRTLLRESDANKLFQPGMRVVIKPNLVVARPAQGGATTHPEIVEGILQFLREQGVAHITIAEGAWVGDSTARAFAVCGYRELARRYGAALLDTKTDSAVKRTAHGLELSVCRSVLEADALINVPVLKGHCQTGVTCCLKNMKGCIPDGEKRRYHTLGLHKPIAALSAVVKPQLHVVDGICGDPTFEEGGNPVQSNRILLGFDGLLLDSYCAGLMGYRPEEIGYLALARQHGLGSFADSSVAVAEFGVEDRPLSAPQDSGLVRRLSRHIEEDGACSACYAALIAALHKTGITPPEALKIGQGFRGQTLSGTGIGRCTRGCKMFVDGCPPQAVDVAEFLQNLRSARS